MGQNCESDRSIESVDALEDLLSEPTPAVVEALGRLDGDLILLGAGGKMGPSLARMARRAFDLAGARREVFAVARFSDPEAERRLRFSGVRTIAADLLAEGTIERLPDAPNVVFMAGFKFGATDQASRTWAVNALLPTLACRRYRNSRIVAFSTGNVYGPTRVEGGGSRESDPLEPVGEYAMSCLGRERLIEYCSREFGTPTALIRLNYAVEMRYGVLVDLARKILEGEPIDLTTGHVNVIWQADANAMTLRAFEHAASPPWVLNVTGPEILKVRDLAEGLAARLDRSVRFRGEEGPAALLNDASLALGLFGNPRVDPDQLVRWTANWIARGGLLLDKPTRFEVADGKF